MKNLLLTIIRIEVVFSRGQNCWLSRKYIIRDRLNQLNPSVPEDGSTGRIAFNVPNKDRMKIKTSRFLTRKLNLNGGFLSDKSIATIAGNINCELFSDDIDATLLRGPAITDAYYREVGAVTCMTPSGDGGGGTCTLLYEDNPDRFQLLVMEYIKDSARAIVHKLDSGEYYMDRVYASCEMLKERMRDYAGGRGWYYRDTDDVGCHGNNAPSDKILVVSNLNYEDGHVPYMDSLINGCTCGPGLTISMTGCCDYELTQTDGSIEVGQICANCEGHVTYDEYAIVNDRTYCDDCANELFSWCSHCAELYPCDEVYYIEDTEEYVCSHCASNYAQCEDCRTYHKEDYAVIDDGIYCCSCAEEYPMCAECGERSIDNDFLDGDSLCEGCRPESESLPTFVPTESRGQQEFDL